MTAHFVFKLLSFLLLYVVSVRVAPSAACFESERAALWDLKSGLYDPYDRLSSWTGRDCCSWAGVRCENHTGHVVRLDLRNPIPYGYAWLSGKLDPSLVALTHLNYLDLSYNDFLGAPLPGFLASLGDLRCMNLSYSNFSGPIPLQFGNISGLRTLVLSSSGGVDPSRSYPFNVYNILPLLQALGALDSLDTLSLAGWGLSGIPQSLPKGSFKSLTSLDLSYNGFNSTIPAWLFNITSLEYLNMAQNSFQGPIPHSIGMLTSLTFLDVSDNGEIIGPIPKQLGNLCNLRSLDLSFLNLSNKLVEFGDAFSGCIKNSLEILDLSASGLTGNLPDWLGDIKNLKHLDLSYNSINGLLPDSIGKLSSLQTLDIANNSIYGSLPDSIGKLSSLQTLEIGGNSFYGSLPDSIRRLSSLITLDLSQNPMTGVLSESYFANMSNLKSLHLSGNTLVINVSQDWFPSFQLEDLRLSSCRLGPQFPRWLRNQTNFHNLDFSNAGIEDAMPDWFWNLTSQLELLDISNNRITGRLPTSLIMGNRDYVQISLNSNLFQGSVPQFLFNDSWLYMDLSNNLLSGSIPPHIAGMKQSLKILSLSMNNLTGTIPSFLCELVELEALDLSNNHLSGELPDCWNQSSNMRFINVASNDLSGTIPSSIGLLPRLVGIHLSDNGFSGEIPSSLKNCTILELLDLSYNELVGNIPRWLPDLKILSLRSNKLTGGIPPQLAQLQSLLVLDLSHNSLSGGIPRNFNNFSAMKTIQTSFEQMDWNLFINDNGRFSKIDSMLLFVKGRQLRYEGLPSIMDLSDNDLSGNIPVELFGLVGLRSLDLSKNHLSGTIHDNIGDLHQLESLDLSRNRLSGKIPQSLSALAWLSFLNLSYNWLEGRIPTGSQLQTLTDPSIYIGNRDLCGLPLPRKCESSDDRGSPPSIDDGYGSLEDWKWALAGAAPGLAVGITIGWWVLLVRDEWRGALFRRVDRVYDTTAAQVFGIRFKRKHNRRSR